MASYDYYVVPQASASLELSDPGNCAILANTDIAQFYCMIIKTDLGWTEVIKFGPVFLDMDELPKSVTYTYDRFEFSQHRIDKAIDNFLNPRGALITQAMEVSKEEAKSIIRDLARNI